MGALGWTVVDSLVQEGHWEEFEEKPKGNERSGPGRATSWNNELHQKNTDAATWVPRGGVQCGYEEAWGLRIGSCLTSSWVVELLAA